MPLQGHAKELFDAYDEVTSAIKLKSILGFERLFKEHPPTETTPGYMFTEIKSAETFKGIWAGRGMYIIASDFKPALDEREGCRLELVGLPVIYRGQADKVGERVQSHLNNSRYREAKAKAKQPPWTRCIKLDKKPGDGGIDFDKGPYRNHRWAVLVLPLRFSATEFRKYAEWGFDLVYGKPIASNERAKAPSNANLDAARARFADELGG